MSKKWRDRGQSAVELALLLPLLLMLLLGAIDLSRAFGTWMILSNAAREGARYGSGHPYDSWDIEYYTIQEVEAEGIAGEDVDLDVDFPSGMDAGEPIIVQLSYDLELLTLGLFGGAPVTIRAKAEMMILG